MVAVERDLRDLQQLTSVDSTPQDNKTIFQIDQKPKSKKIRNAIRKGSGALAIAGLAVTPTALLYSGLQIFRLGGQELNINYQPKQGTFEFKKDTENTENKIGFGIDAAKASAGGAIVGIVVFSALSRKESVSSANLSGNHTKSATT